MNEIVEYLIERLSEASTWLSASVLVTLFEVSPEVAGTFVTLVAAVGAFLGAVLPEGRPSKKDSE